jgi:DNA-binding IclR family transcriptional regulator
VHNALAILDYICSVQNEPKTLSEIARGAGLNMSTCFNILKTLEDGLVVSFDRTQKTYKLGLRLAELGTLVDARSQAAQLVLDEVRRIADTVGLSCFLMGQEHDSFVVLDKVESSKPIRVTIDRGARFPLTGAVAAKAWLAWSSHDVVHEVIRRHGLEHHTERSITDIGQFQAELASTRDRGYSTSIGEYYPGHNAVAAPVFNVDGSPLLLVVVVGADNELSGPELTRVGEEVRAGAERATKRIGGRRPS